MKQLLTIAFFDEEKGWVEDEIEAETNSVVSPNYVVDLKVSPQANI